MCADRAVKYQLIQHRLLEPEGSEPDFTRGTLEGVKMHISSADFRVMQEYLQHLTI